MTRVYKSNGPDIKIRGTASHIAEKYLQLARDARSSGDPVAAENYYQHAEHYFRLIATAQEQFRQNQQPRGDEPISKQRRRRRGRRREFLEFRPGAGLRPTAAAALHARPRPARSPAACDNQAYQRDNQQPREHRERDHRAQPQYQPQPLPLNQPQPVVADAGSVDRLPSFITGAQPQ